MPTGSTRSLSPSAEDDSDPSHVIWISFIHRDLFSYNKISGANFIEQSDDNVLGESDGFIDDLREVEDP